MVNCFFWEWAMHFHMIYLAVGNVRECCVVSVDDDLGASIFRQVIRWIGYPPILTMGHSFFVVS